MVSWRKTSCYSWCFLKCTKIQVDHIGLRNSRGNLMLQLHSLVFKLKDLILHVITSLSLSRTYLPINPPVQESLIWGMECDPRQFPEPCVCSETSLVCLCVLVREHMPRVSCRPWEQEQVHPSPPWAFARSGCRAPVAALTCLTTAQILCSSDSLAVHHPDESSDLPCLSAELSQVKFCRFPKVGKIWLGGRGREEGRECAVI